MHNYIVRTAWRRERTSGGAGLIGKYNRMQIRHASPIALVITDHRSRRDEKVATYRGNFRVGAMAAIAAIDYSALHRNSIFWHFTL